MSLAGKNAVVTGGAMGIGKALAEILLQHGAKVALLDVHKDAGESLMKALNEQHGPHSTVFLECDVESEEQFKAAFQKAVDAFGGVDIMCNNAGIMNEVAWEKMVSINFMGAVRGTYLALEHMKKVNGGRGGVVINTASLAGVNIFPSCPVYTATKHAVVSFTRAMAAFSEMSGFGIRFNAVCPSIVQTSLVSDMLQKLGQFAQVAGQQKARPVLQASEVAECVLELLMDETKNGEALIVLKEGKKFATFTKID